MTIDLTIAQSFGKVLCDVLGLDSDLVYRLEIDCDVHDITRLRTYSYTRINEGKINELEKIVKHYELNPIKGKE